MIHQPYQAEIETVVLHVMAGLDGVTINRYIRNERGVVTGIEKKIDVPLKYNQRSRTLADLIQINRQHSFPFMAVTLQGVNLDNTRNHQKDSSYNLMGITPEGGYPKIHTPVPVTLNLALDIISTFQEDLLQIYNNFIAYFNPYIQISWKEPFSGQELITKVRWDGNAPFGASNPLPNDEGRIFKTTLNIVADSFIFREEQEPETPILCFDLEWYALSSSNMFLYDPPSGTLVGELFLCSTPCVWSVYPTCLSAGDTLTVYGNNLDNVDAVFLLGPSSVVPELSSASSIEWCYEPTDIPTENYYDIYEFNQILSADNPPFYGLSVTDFRNVGENALTVVLPTNLGSGFVDIRLASTQSGYTDITDAESQPGCTLSWTASGLFVD